MTTILTQPEPTALAPKIIYPETDGEPMAETDVHRKQLGTYLVDPLIEHFRDNPEIYVSGNLILYYEEGSPRKHTAPDVFVVKGVGDYDRRTYKLWEEEVAPCFIIEVTSTSTRRNDWREKRFLFEDLGVAEYFLFDPYGEYMKPPLQGFRLVEGYYQQLEPKQLATGELEFFSDQLQLVLRTVGSSLRLYDPDTDEVLRSLEEAEFEREMAIFERARAEDARQQAEEARQQAETQRDDALAEIERLKKLLDQQD